MNTTTMRTMIAAAALVVAAGSASAQTFRAEIPMPFRAAGKLMAPGSYEIRETNASSNGIAFVHSTTDSKGVMLLLNVKSDAPKQWLQKGDPKLAFECVNGGCTLRRLYNGFDEFLYDFPGPKAPAANIVAGRSEMVTLSMVRTH